MEGPTLSLERAGERMASEDDIFGEITWTDVLGYTSKDWEAIRDTAGRLEDVNAFGGDWSKCLVGAFILWINAGNGQHTPDSTDDKWH